ncbi:TetR family transcriptional regulator [Marinobacter daepoensis]|uniref:TetR family transcriptional regulator n=1 Tax=Marinobacter daepoensis TaxID=262077 RepID=A0ABS3BF22_9GAMM|nr:TetR family transcriptional regulator [Marinobacter daepoensis]MBN7770357.1 TetR family transcriptional regulator [Marinobacter daepoensis]MBY6079803.1 TetR family transcriptional regulator [Marinobacter daepoensis]
MARKTKAEAEATRESILDAAESVFTDKGVARASLEEIARTAGVTRGAVYWHFRNKKDILDAMLNRVRGPLAEMLDESATSDDTLANLKHLCVVALSKLAEDEQYFRVYYILFHRNESDQALNKHLELADEGISFVTTLLSRPENRRQLRPDLSPELAAYLLHTQMLGLFFEWLANPERWPLASIAPILVETIFRGILSND